MIGDSDSVQSRMLRESAAMASANAVRARQLQSATARAARFERLYYEVLRELERMKRRCTCGA